MHLPSAAKLWHIPQEAAFPMPSILPPLSTPLDVQAASYFALSPSILSFSKSSNPVTSQKKKSNIHSAFFIIAEHTFDCQ